jgi:hypothetical protein
MLGVEGCTEGADDLGIGGHAQGYFECLAE